MANKGMALLVNRFYFMNNDEKAEIVHTASLLKNLLIAFGLTVCCGLLVACSTNSSDDSYKQNDMSFSGVKTVNDGDLSMDYFSFGNGNKNFVILPGIAITSVMKSSDAIMKQYACFAKDYKVYVFDRRKNNPENYSVNDMAEDTYKAMKSLKIDKADIFGASQGGCIALCIAENHPDIVHSLTMCSSTSKTTDVDKQKFSVAEAYASKNDVEGLNNYLINMFYSEKFYQQHKESIDKSRSIGTVDDLHRFNIFCEAQKNFDATDRLKQVNCPVYVIASNADKVFEIDNANYIIENLGCDSFIYSDYGHVVYDEAPDCIQKVFDFCNKSHTK